ncbi:oligosaccharide flippase family protein [Daejeonella oryzae]|uniref:oligosaccharide flippase family protein n=1 Tax=Daejeonella oryzae TaxID=1122943 RepID=UPI0004035A66|nr:oligosaccharide flippase family protein [Daejeonella oryzae]
MSTLRKFAGQTIIYGASTIIARLLNFILTPIFTRIYPAKVYGIFTYMYSWASMLNAVLAFGMETTFFRYLNKHEDEKDKVYNNTFLTIVITSFLFLLFTFLFVDDIAAWMQRGKEVNKDYALYVKYFVYILLADALAVIPFAKIRADGRPLRYGLIKLVNILTFIGFNFLFIFIIPYIIKTQGFGADFLAVWFKPQWVGYVFLSNLIASIVTLILLLPELLQLRLKFEPRIVKEMLIYSFPVLVANISFIINENVDKIFLGMLLPAEISETEVGIYGACAKLAIFLSIFVQAFRLGAEPFFFGHAKEKNSGETYARIMTWFVIAVSLIFVALSANIEILKYFIGGGDEQQQSLYWSGLKIVPVLLFGYASLGIYMNLSIWYKLSDQTRFGLYISLIAAVLTIVLNLIFIPKYSYVASAWISLTAYASMMIMSYYLGQKNYPIPYNVKKNISYLLVSAVLVYISFSIFNRDLIIGNSIFLLFAVATFYLERKEVKLLLRS